jgi:hypothetical protein
MSVSVGGGSIWLFSSGAAIDFAGCGTISSGAAGCGGGAQAGANLRADGRVVREREARRVEGRASARSQIVVDEKLL